ncbi:hypothetical protein QR680_014802 [Steinernema hermaphroditum]|uniref:Arrestin C-terminal-like domain-containing protein n=1 Tax=Steinernema hermaphroditum TaxID=289476 RepID=A0AA39ICE0_9BILA|nr:hypothetical protein QR680_014802 [Steinernema hermaphroditum]
MGIFNGGVDVFEIQNLNIKPGGYESGDTITGKVLLVLRKEIRCNEFFVSILGEIRTEWTQYKGGAHYEDHYQSGSVIMNEHKELKSERVLSAGEHTETFSFRLPEQCPPSFASSYGSITYVLQAKIDRPMAADNDVTLPIMVKGTVDLNKLDSRLAISQPVFNSADVEIPRCCCFKSEFISSHIKIQKKGYAFGELIKMDITVDNGTSKPIDKILINLLEHAVFTAELCSSFFSSNNEKIRRTVSRPVITADTEANIAPHSQKTVHVAIRVTESISPMVCSTLIQTKHQISISVQQGWSQDEVIVALPVLIGTIPVVAKENIESETAPISSGQSSSKN